MKLGSTRNRYSGAVVCDIQRRLTARSGGYAPGSALRVTVKLTLLPSASLQAASPKLTVTAEPLGGGGQLLSPRIIAFLPILLLHCYKKDLDRHCNVITT